jgi:TolB protein
MITQTGVAQVPAAPVETLPYDLWKQVSADEVLVGGIRQSGTTFQVDVRVMSVERKVATFARTYPCPSSAKGLRRCAHTIADEWHKERFGLDGVARTRFAFTSDRDGERQNGPVADRAVKEIYVSDYDGHGAMRVSVRGSLNIAPTWAPDGRAIAYQSYQSNFSDFYLQKLDEVQLQLARPGRGSDVAQNYLPDWSPDGSRIAFASSRDGNFEIYVVKVDGSDMRRLTSNQADDNAPAWHPNGTQIAFTSDRTGRNQIYMMSADGGPATQITNEPGDADRPTWSTLDYIVYSTTVPGAQVQIKRIKPGSRDVVQLTDGPGNNESPTVAPNGRHIAFVTNRWGGKEQIAVMDIDGRNVRQLTFTGNNKFPRWSHR